MAGYWAQTGRVSLPVVIVSAAAILHSLAPQALSTPARFVRRRSTESAVCFDDNPNWQREQLLTTWEKPLCLLTWTTVAVAIGLLVTHI